MNKVVNMVIITASLMTTSAIAGDFEGSIKAGSFKGKYAGIDQVKISITEAIETAQKSVDGRVVEAELEKEDGYLVWEIKVLDNNEEKHEIIIDPVTGEVLHQEMDD